MRATWTIRPVVWVGVAAFSFAAWGLVILLALIVLRMVGL